MLEFFENVYYERIDKIKLRDVGLIYLDFAKECDKVPHVGRGGALVEIITFNRRVVGSTPDLAVT